MEIPLLKEMIDIEDIGCVNKIDNQMSECSGYIVSVAFL